MPPKQTGLSWCCSSESKALRRVCALQSALHAGALNGFMEGLILCGKTTVHNVFVQRNSTLKAPGCVCLAWHKHYEAFKQQEHSKILFVLFVFV